MSTERTFHPNANEPKPPLPCREVWRLGTAAGEVVLFESMEEVLFEARTAPYQDRREIVPILRLVCERNTMVQVGPLRRVTLVVEGLYRNGTVLETKELIVDDVAGFGEGFGHSVGCRFGALVTSVRVAGWWIEPKP
jgi:hypothetical protein